MFFLSRDSRENSQGSPVGTVLLVTLLVVSQSLHQNMSSAGAISVRSLDLGQTYALSPGG